jgi:hypothetical protein
MITVGSRNLLQQILGAMLLSALVTGCAEPAKVNEMAAGTRPGASTPSNPVIHEAVCVEQVAGGKLTNPIWVSEVDNLGFLRALEHSLDANRLLVKRPEDCRFGINANLLGLSQPFIGIDVEVTANVNYTVRQAGVEAPYMLLTETSAYTTRFTEDKILWGQRLQEANEGAIRKNIGAFIDALLASKPKP